MESHDAGFGNGLAPWPRVVRMDEGTRGMEELASMELAGRQGMAPARRARGIEAAPPLDEAEQVFDAAAQLFAVLSCATRLGILCQLRRGSLAVRQVAKACGISQPCASLQLKMLWQHGLLLRECRGREVVYALERSPLLECLCDFAWRVEGADLKAGIAHPGHEGSR